MSRVRRESCFGNRLRTRLKELQWSQYELAYRSGIHVTTINKICKQNYEPLFNTATAIALAVGVPLQDFTDVKHEAFSEVVPFEEGLGFYAK